ncbi:MAG: hypothetical protein JWP99_519 [Devosia sp.]|nr:hypothetical protein [Devosia sp.]
MAGSSLASISKGSVNVAIARLRAPRHAQAKGEELVTNLSRRIASLRKEIAAMSAAANAHSADSLSEVQHRGLALAREVETGSRLVARHVGQQAGHAGRLIQQNPVPAIVILGTMALVSSLFFSRD